MGRSIEQTRGELRVNPDQTRSCTISLEEIKKRYNTLITSLRTDVERPEKKEEDFKGKEPNNYQSLNKTTQGHAQPGKANGFNAQSYDSFGVFWLPTSL